MKNHYELLNISKTASYQEIKTAYRKLAIRYHPDKNPNNPHAEELFKQISIAYDTLSSPAKKSRYDAILSYQQFQTFSPPTNRQPQSHYRPRKHKRPTQQTVYTRKSWLNLSNKHFIITFILSSILIFGIIGLANIVQYQQQEALRKKQLAEKITYIKLTKESKQQLVDKNYETSILVANQLVKVLPKHYTSTNFQHTILADITKSGIADLKEGRYNKAIEAFTALISNNTLPQNKETFYYYLSLSYYYNNQAERAISQLLALKNYDHPETPTLLATIYRDEFNNPKEALIWHAVAKQLLSDRYKNVGFQFVPSDAPQEHFNAYYQSAITNYNLKNYEAALQDLRGALFLRSANRDALYMKGLCELELGLPDACISFEKAKKNGHVFVDEVIEKNCK